MICGSSMPSTFQAVIIETHDVNLDEVVLVPLKPDEKMQFPQ
jgi:hypothetical protein